VTPQLADMRRPAEAPRQKIVVEWPDDGAVIEVLPADADAIRSQAAALVASVRQRLRQAAEETTSGPEAAEAARLHQQLLEAQRQQASDAQALREAKATAKKGIEDGVGPITLDRFDQAVEKAEKQVVRQTHRVEHLRRLARDAAHKAERIAQDALKRARAEVQAEWTAKHAAALQAVFYDVVQGPLAELLALRLALDSLA
jgi:hypothetical protein